MKIVDDYRALELDGSVLSIGGFDGLHLGHREIINRSKHISLKESIPVVVVTFNPLPKTFFGNGVMPIVSLDQRAELLREMLIDYLVIIQFTEKFSRVEATTFIDSVSKHLRPKHIVTGADHKFGYRRKGDADFIKKYADETGCSVSIVPSVQKNGIEVRSSTIRSMILNSNVSQAASLLGYRYFIDGMVVRGKGLGKKIGFPTANISVDQGSVLVPRNGVYCVEIEYNSNSLKGMCNIGIRPTVDKEGLRSIEVHIFSDSSLDLYDKSIRVFFLEYIREEIKYKSIERLAEQLQIDRAACLESN